MMNIVLIILGIICIAFMLLLMYAMCKVASSVEHDYEEDLERIRNEFASKNKKNNKKK